MYERLDNITLRGGERVEAGVVAGPDAEWASRIRPLLQHKGDPWNWQVAQFLERDLDVESYFYILHRDGNPFANIMTIETDGVGPFGHVWTEPADRKKGASSSLMALQMDHFRSRGGRALFLGTGYDSVPYKMYERFGFHGIEPLSGFMDYYVESETDFNEAFFAPGPSVVEPLGWSHYPAMQPLFLGNWPGIVRYAAVGANGRVLMEEEPLPLIERNESAQDTAPRSLVLRNTDTGAVVGFAALSSHPLWYGMGLVDVFCHPAHWDQAPELLAALDLPAARRYAAYADPSCPQKIDVLETAGFRQGAAIPNWLSVDIAQSAFADLLVFEQGS